MPKQFIHGILDMICLLIMMSGIASLYVLGVAAGLE